MSAADEVDRQYLNCCMAICREAMKNQIQEYLLDDSWG